MIDFSKTLGHCTDIVLNKTKSNTTQYFNLPVESERREYPRQHRNQRLLPLHFRQLPGRTSCDTFFSSIKSVRGFTCVQLFAVAFADYLWAKCLRRESQVPGAYADFCKEVGAPNELLSDNSKVQHGKKFTTIDRQNSTHHIYSTPHCQNQNMSERKIQDVKHKTEIILYKSLAPLVFWCYAVIFAIDCLNYTSHAKLDWRTPAGVLTSNTVDISVF